MRRETKTFGSLLNSEGNERSYDSLLEIQYGKKRHNNQPKIIFECQRCSLGPCNSNEGLRCEGLSELLPNLQQIAHARNEEL